MIVFQELQQLIVNYFDNQLKIKKSTTIHMREKGDRWARKSLSDL